MSRMRRRGDPIPTLAMIGKPQATTHHLISNLFTIITLSAHVAPRRRWDSYPYSTISVFALHPQVVSWRRLLQTGGAKPHP